MQTGRKITVTAFYTPVKVISVYKGNNIFNGKQLQIIENVAKQSMYNELYSFYGYVPLYANNEYILCLTKKKWNKAKVPTKYENSEYYVTSLSAFGVFRPTNEKQTKLIVYRTKNVTINNIQGLDIMTDSKDVLNQYYNLKKELFNKYSIT